MADRPNQEVNEQIAAELEAGRKIEAIKLYRESTGKGLKEAKEFIDALIPELIQQDPDKYAKLASSGGAGCASMIILCLSAAAALFLACSCFTLS